MLTKLILLTIQPILAVTIREIEKFFFFKKTAPLEVKTIPLNWEGE